MRGLSELPERQQEVLRNLTAGLAASPQIRGKAMRGERDTRVVSRGGYRAVYKIDRANRVVDVLAITAPLASVVGDRLSVWELPKFKALLKQPVGAPLELTREESLAIAKEAFASRPDLPPGDEYARQIRPIWAGLVRRRNG